MMLDVTEVVQVQLPAREREPGEPRGSRERSERLRAERLVQLHATDVGISESLLSAQPGRGSKNAVIPPSVMEVPQLEGILSG